MLTFKTKNLVAQTKAVSFSFCLKGETMAFCVGVQLLRTLTLKLRQGRVLPTPEITQALKYQVSYFHLLL